MPRTSQRRVLQHGRPRRALQPGLELHLRRLEQVRRSDGPWRPTAAPTASSRCSSSRTASCTFPSGTRSSTSRGCRTATTGLGSKPVHAALGGHGLARSGRHRGGAARARALAARDDRRQEPVHRRRRGAQLRRQRPHRARGGLRQCLDPAGRRRRRHRDRLRLLRPPGAPEKAAHLRDEAGHARHRLHG